MRVAFLLLLLAAPLAYQFTAPLTSPTPGANNNVIPTTTPGGLYTRSVAADLDGDGLRDLALVCDNSIEIMIGPAVFHCWDSDMGATNDIARLPGSSGQDDLVLVGQNGAQILSFAWDEQQQPMAPTWTLTTLESDEWDDATCVAVREVSGDSTPRIFGVMSDGTSVRALIDSGSGYVDTALFDVGKTIDDMVVLEWDGTDPPEVAVTTPYDPNLTGSAQKTSLLVYRDDTQSGWYEEYANRATGFDTVTMAAGRQGSRPEEWIAWFSSWNTNPDNEAFIIVDEFGASSAQWVPSDPHVTRATTGDWDTDGNDDLFLGVRTSHSIVSLRNLGTTSPSFGTAYNSPAPPGIAELVVIPLGPSGPATNTVAWPVIADLDNDGHDDVAMAIQSTGGILIDRNGPPGPGPYVASTPQAEISMTCDSDTIVFDFDSEQEWPTGVENEYTVEAEVAIFEQVNGTTNEVSITAGRATEAGETLTLDLDTEIPTNAIYYMVVQFVDVYDGPEIVRCHTAQVYGIQLQDDPSQNPQNHQYLDEVRNGAFFDLWNDCPNDGVRIGSGAPLPGLPNLSEGVHVLIRY